MSRSAPVFRALTSIVFVVVAMSSGETRLYAQSWILPVDGTWSVGANWSGGVVPSSGPTTQLLFGSFLSSAYTATNDTGINPFILNGLTLNNESSTTLNVSNGVGNSIRFAGVNPFIQMSGPGAATISGPGSTTLDLAAPVTINGNGTGLLTIASAVSGAGSLLIDRPNLNYLGVTEFTRAMTFIGGVTLRAGGLAVRGPTTEISLGSGPLTVATTGIGLSATGYLRGADNTLLNAAVINKGATLNILSDFSFKLSNSISGSGGVNIGNLVDSGIVVLQAANNYEGPTRVTTGSLTFSGANGSLTSVAPIIDLLRNTALSLDNSAANKTDRLPSNVVVNMARANFSLIANGTSGNNASQTIATLNGEGQNTIRVNPTLNTAAVLSIGDLNRVNRGTFFAGFTSTGGILGGIPGNNCATILLSSINGAPPASSLIGSGAEGTPTVGVFPFIFTDHSSGGGGSTFATYSSSPGFGLRPLNLGTEVVTALTPGSVQPNPARNVRLLAGVPGLSATATVNSLSLSAPNNNGLWGFGGATGSLTVASGGILTSNGTPTWLNMGSLNFGTAEGQLYATAAPLHVNARLTGSNGLTINSHATTDNLETRLMNANNNYTGSTTVNFGVLSVLQNANLGTGANPVTLNGGQLRFIGESETINRSIFVGGAGGAIQMAPWAAASTNPVLNHYSKTLTVSGNISGTGQLAFNGNPTGGSATTGGTILLTGDNSSYSGLPIISSGIVSVSNIDTQLGSGSNVQLRDAFLVVTGTTPQITTKNFYLASTAQSVLITGSGVDLTINGFITNSVASSFTKSGPGSLTLTNAATHSGSTIVGPFIGPFAHTGPAAIAGGMLTLTENGAITNSGNVAVTEGATLVLRNEGAVNSANRVGGTEFSLSGGTFHLVGAANAPSSEVVGRLSTGPNTASTVSVAPGAGQTATIAFQASGAPIQRSFGDTIIFRGSTVLGTGPSASEIRFVSTGGNEPPLTNNVIVGAFGSDSNGTGMVTTSAIATGVVSIRQLTAAEYVSTVPISGGSSQNVKTGTGNSLSSSLTSINSLTLVAGGSVTITGGAGNTLGLGSGNLILAPGNSGLMGGRVIANSGSSQLFVHVPGTAVDVSTVSSILAASASGTINKSGGGTLLMRAPVGDGSGLNMLNIQEGALILGTGASVATNAAVYVQSSATLESNLAPMQVRSISGYGTIVMGNNTLTLDNINGSSDSLFNGTITGNGNIIKTGSGTLHLSYSSHVTAPIEVQLGKVSFSAPNSSGGTVTLNPVIAGLSAQLDPVGPSGNATTASTFARNVVVSPSAAGSSQIVNTSSGSVNMTGSLTVPTGQSLTINVANSGLLQFSGSITGGGSITTTNLGTSLFSGINDYSGGTTLGTTNGGQIGIGSDTAFGTGPVNINANNLTLFAANGNRNLNNALTITTDFTVDSLVGPHDLSFGTGSAATLAGSGTSRTITITSAGNFALNSLSGSGSVQSLVKLGGGSLTLTGNCTYTGATTVSAGSLIVANGAQLNGSGAVTVGGAARAVLGGSGTIAGPVTLTGTATVSPGTSAGNMTLQNGLTYAAGATYLWELAANTTSGPGSNWDRIVLTGGSLSINTAAVFVPGFIGDASTPDASIPFWQVSRRWDNIIELTGTASNLGGSAFTIDNSLWSSAGSFSTMPATVGNGIALVWTPVPEPLHLLLVCASISASVRLYRFRARKLTQAR